jgi:hypothetical protein
VPNLAARRHEVVRPERRNRASPSHARDGGRIHRRHTRHLLATRSVAERDGEGQSHSQPNELPYGPPHPRMMRAIVDRSLTSGTNRSITAGNSSPAGMKRFVTANVHFATKP